MGNYWDIPENVDELFKNIPASYSITDPDLSGDNIYAMQLFLDNVEGLEDLIIEFEGTQIICKKDDKTICIDSGGLGDFYLHGFEVSEV